MNRKRILIKLSGEALALPLPNQDTAKPSRPFADAPQQNQNHISSRKSDACSSQLHDGLYHPKTMSYVASSIKNLVAKGYTVAIVVGGGNIVRGNALTKAFNHFNQVDADHMGMLATVINGIALKHAFSQVEVESCLLNALGDSPVAPAYTPDKALKHLGKNRIVVCVGGSGHGYFTTDTASALRALEMQCDVMIKVTDVDGVYAEDPKVNKQAVRYDHLSFSEVIEKGLKVLDLTAFTLLRAHNLPLIVGSISRLHDLSSLIKGDGIATRIS